MLTIKDVEALCCFSGRCWFAAKPRCRVGLVGTDRIRSKGSEGLSRGRMKQDAMLQRRKQAFGAASWQKLLHWQRGDETMGAREKAQVPAWTAEGKLAAFSPQFCAMSTTLAFHFNILLTALICCRGVFSLASRPPGQRNACRPGSREGRHAFVSTTCVCLKKGLFCTTCYACCVS